MHLWQMSRHCSCIRKTHITILLVRCSRTGTTKGTVSVDCCYLCYTISLIEFAGHNLSDLDKMNETLYKWVNAERFPTFPKITRGNINQLFLTNKNLVLAVVEENQLEEIAPDMLEFRDMVESVIKKKREKYHE